LRATPLPQDDNRIFGRLVPSLRDSVPLLPTYPGLPSLRQAQGRLWAVVCRPSGAGVGSPAEREKPHDVVKGLDKNIGGNAEAAGQAANVVDRERPFAVQNFGDQGFVLEHIQEVLLLKPVGGHKFF
jgi:hypothetical protein